MNKGRPKKNPQLKTASSVVRLKISQHAYDVFKKNADLLRMPLAAYVRLYLDDSLERRKELPTLAHVAM